MLNHRRLFGFLRRLGNNRAVPALMTTDINGNEQVTTSKLHHSADGIAVGLTSWQLKAVHKSWLRIKTVPGEVGIALFRVLFEKFPDSKGVFGLKWASNETALADGSVKMQALIIEDTVSMVIFDLLNDGDGLRWQLVCVGEAHTHFFDRGFHPVYLELLVDALLEYVAQRTSRNRFKRWKMLRVWKQLLLFISSCLLRGMQLGRAAALVPETTSSNRSSRHGSHNPQRVHRVNSAIAANFLPCSPLSERFAVVVESGTPIITPRESRSSSPQLTNFRNSSPSPTKVIAPHLQRPLLNMMNLSVPIRV